MIEIRKEKSALDLADWKQAHLKTLAAAWDGYWETAVVANAEHFSLLFRKERVGYCVIDGQNRLLQFYVNNPALADDLFACVLDTGYVATAVAATLDPPYLSLCLDRQKKVAINTYLFHDHAPVSLPSPYPEAEFRLATPAHLHDLVEFYGRNDEYEDQQNIAASFGNRLGYAQALIARQQVFLLQTQEAIVAIGECRLSQSQPTVADLGMIVDVAHRRRGLGAYILTRLKTHAIHHGRQPICSCAADNIPSRKTIEKAGFVTQHRLLDIWF